MRVNSLRGRSILSVDDLSIHELQDLIDFSERIGKSMTAGLLSLEKENSVLAAICPAEARARFYAEVAARRLRASTVRFGWEEAKGSLGVNVFDFARSIGRIVDCAVVEGSDHSFMEGIAKTSNIPVLNALSEKEAPALALADFATLKSKLGKLSGLNLAYIGAGDAISNSVILAAAKCGVKLKVATSDRARPSIQGIARAKVEAEKTGGSVELVSTPRHALEDAGAVYWNFPQSQGGDTPVEFPSISLEALLDSGAKKGVLVLRGFPMGGNVIRHDSPMGLNEIFWEQSENRIYSFMALLSSVI